MCTIYWFLISQELAVLPNSQGIAPQMPSLYSLKTSLYRSRRARLPPLPQNRADLDLSGEWCKTLNGNDFVVADDGSTDRTVIFCTVDNLHRLAEAEKWFVDGTFHAAPAIFYQLFTIHVMIHNQVYTLFRHHAVPSNNVIML